jgi:hypothetical protein
MDQSWSPAKLDLALAAGIAISLPFAAGFLYDRTGAFIPMLIYYGLAWGVVKWRRGSTGYGNSFPHRPPRAFYLNVGLILVGLICAWMAPITHPDAQPLGVWLSALIWAPVNAATEQILWIYIFDAWDLYPPQLRLAYRLLGLFFFSAFVGLIHALFWVEFLHTVQAGTLFGTIFVVITSLTGFIHIIVWRQSRQMVFTFIPHFLLNLLPFFWTNYSMVPYLFQFGN